ncbi:MAG: hypothetical protein IKA47_06060 [Oscillospiraceae bacterium]|nr:hypothetical protein [Oscillospiraceae bacterium]MBR2420965.1 hypothetical protein [Oscillospiraceae bacterium]
MATTLEQYNQMKQQLTAKIADGTMTVDQLLGYQELLYRISVLESCMNFVKTAPVTNDMKVMSYHYQVVEALFTCLVQERQFGIPADDVVRKQRATALENLQTVVNSFRKQFQSFKPAAPEAYRAAVTKMVNTILPAWLQYRFTYIPF